MARKHEKEKTLMYWILKEKNLFWKVSYLLDIEEKKFEVRMYTRTGKTINTEDKMVVNILNQLFMNPLHIEDMMKMYHQKEAGKILDNLILSWIKKKDL